MTPEEFRAAAHELVDWIADYRASVGERPVRSEVTPDWVRAALDGPPPEDPEDFASVVRDLSDVIVPGVTQTHSPGYYAWFPSNASLESVLGDMASSGVAALGITWQSAPALTEMEQVVTDWLRELCGLSTEWHGAIHDTASTACLVALLAARERATGLSEDRGGLQAEQLPVTVYASSQAHSSVTKGVLLAGFGRDNLRVVPVDPVTYAMDVDALRRMMAEDVAGGRRPGAVVASLGTTGTTAFDDVTAIVDVARTHGAWVHVDAAMAGSAMLLPECRELFRGVDGADSFGWNPHKWMGTILDCSLLYVRDVELLIRVFSTNPSYLRSTADGEVTQYKDWGIPLGRRFRAMKLWFHLRLAGAEAIRQRLRRDLANAQWLARAVQAESDWEVCAPVALQTVCLRHHPPGVTDPAALDAHQQAWAEAINATGRAFVTPAQVEGRWLVRVSIGAEATELDDVAALWALCRESVRAVNP
ncbi:MAG: aspartate aminotransferase family protein [Actinomycetales bacterium mxb001]|nr:MAG: aspartate aminotransferase family protein [Actinomycetales bacterium mxb001]